MSTSATTSSSNAPNETLEKVTQQVAQACEAQQEDFGIFIERVGSALCAYSRQRPGVAATAILGLGFFVGWKIKPW